MSLVPGVDGAYYIIDLGGVVFSTDGFGTSATEVIGVLQPTIPTGFPEHSYAYEHTQEELDWDLAEAIAASPDSWSITTISPETYSGALDLTLFGGNPGYSYGTLSHDGATPGSLHQKTDYDWDQPVPASSTYTAPYPKIYVRFLGSAPAYGSISVKARVRTGKFQLVVDYDRLPGDIGITLSVEPIEGGGEPEPTPLFWTGFLGTREIP